MIQAGCPRLHQPQLAETECKNCMHFSAGGHTHGLCPALMEPYTQSSISCWCIAAGKVAKARTAYTTSVRNCCNILLILLQLSCRCYACNIHVGGMATPTAHWRHLGVVNCTSSLNATLQRCTELCLPCQLATVQQCMPSAQQQSSTLASTRSGLCTRSFKGCGAVRFVADTKPPKPPLCTQQALS